MDNQQIFMFKGAQVRTVDKSGEPWFVLRDVCDVLDLRAPDVKQRLSDDVVSTHTVSDSLGRANTALIINEDGLYDTILESRKKEARAFRKWITSDVLPSIRKTGSYGVNRLPQNYVEALEALVEQTKTRLALEAEVKERDETLSLQAPKVALYDTAMNANNNKAVGTVAKMIGYGPYKLFAFLREMKVLRQNNEPYQEYIDRGYFDLRLYSIPHTSGDIENKTQTLVTPKGISYIHKILVEHGKVGAASVLHQN